MELRGSRVPTTGNKPNKIMKTTKIMNMVAESKKKLCNNRPAETTPTEWGCTIADIKREISDQAISSHRLGDDWVRRCNWFNLTEKQKTEAIKKMPLTP